MPRLRTLGCLPLIFTALSCGEQEIRAIDEFSIAPGGANSPKDRGRVQVRDGNLLTDKGTRLRGVTLGVDVFPPRTPLAPELFTELAHSGLNAFHVYLENSAIETGSRLALADDLVELTAASGLYLVITLGGGNAGGTFDLEKTRTFWELYAPRYASRTHVIYEIQNIPDPRCDVAYAEDTLAMQQEIHDLIRQRAPSTHVALFSFMNQPTPAALDANLGVIGGSIDWSKASVAFHSTPCAGQRDLAGLLAVTRTQGIATFVSEMPFRTSVEDVAQLENEGVGWFNFEYLVRTRDLAAFRSAHDAAALTWCPDFGTWPEDAETCRTP